MSQLTKATAVTLYFLFFLPLPLPSNSHSHRPSVWLPSQLPLRPSLQDYLPLFSSFFLWLGGEESLRRERKKEKGKKTCAESSADLDSLLTSWSRRRASKSRGVREAAWWNIREPSDPPTPHTGWQPSQGMMGFPQWLVTQWQRRRRSGKVCGSESCTACFFINPDWTL